MGIETAILGSAILGAAASRSATKAQVGATDRAADLQREMFERQVELSKPYREAGEAALNRLIPMASEYTPFGMQQFQADPGYAFRMAEGMKGLERSAAARGGLLSGATLKGIQRYGQDLGSQEYQNAFDRYQLERQARLGPLQSLAGLGQTSAQTLGGQAGQYGMNMANLATGAGAARAAGQIGMANALAGGASQYLNYQGQQNLINALRGGGSIGYGAGYAGEGPMGYAP
jgi:hypothetical protein